MSGWIQDGAKTVCKCRWTKITRGKITLYTVLMYPQKKNLMYRLVYYRKTDQVHISANLLQNNIPKHTVYLYNRPKRAWSSVYKITDQIYQLVSYRITDQRSWRYQLNFLRIYKTGQIYQFVTYIIRDLSSSWTPITEAIYWLIRPNISAKLLQKNISLAKISASISYRIKDVIYQLTSYKITDQMSVMKPRQCMSPSGARTNLWC